MTSLLTVIPTLVPLAKIVSLLTSAKVMAAAIALVTAVLRKPEFATKAMVYLLVVAPAVWSGNTERRSAAKAVLDTLAGGSPTSTTASTADSGANTTTVTPPPPQPCHLAIITPGCLPQQPASPPDGLSCHP